METRLCTSIDPASSGSICQAALREIFEREMKHLLWLAEAIIGDPLVAKRCVAAAILRADGSAYVASDWRAIWIRRCVARDAVERKSTEIKRIAANYVRDAVCKRPPDSVAWDKQAIASLPANKISQSLNALERAALILHAYLGFSTHDCALLIGCHWSLIEPACSNAAWRIFREQINTCENAVELGFSGVPA
jgi:DNA-directed RNA polymerase specialized sigma24 family protein